MCYPSFVKKYSVGVTKILTSSFKRLLTAFGCSENETTEISLAELDYLAVFRVNSAGNLGFFHSLTPILAVIVENTG